MPITEIGVNADDIQTNAGDILDLQAKTVVAFSGTVSVDSATTKPASNLTLSVAHTGYDYMDVFFEDTSDGVYAIQRVDFTSGGTRKILEAKRPYRSSGSYR